MLALPDFTDIALMQKEEKEKAALLKQEEQEEAFLYHIEQAIAKTQLNKEAMLEIFIEALKLPYGDELLKEAQRLEFKYHTKANLAKTVYGEKDV